MTGHSASPLPASALQALRNNERHAQSIGYNPFRFKFTALWISAGLVGTVQQRMKSRSVDERRG
jgi:hypothetical protein